MRVSQRLDYALRALILLAMQPEGTFVAAGDLADRLGLPRRFVEQQITSLSRAGIVSCRRGPSGGCAFERDPAEVSVRDVVIAVNGAVIDVPKHPYSASAELWQEAAGVLGESLGVVTLAELASRQRELDAESAPIYYI